MGFLPPISTFMAGMRGDLASGKLADLVILEGDPTADISNSRKIHAVWHRGKKAAGPVETFAP
jgi:imidazolonepropionase-like amidohydrolase